MQNPCSRQIKRVLTLMVCTIGATSLQSARAEQWYPQSADAYPGTHFHCNVQPLQSGAPGIKDEDKVFVDHCLAVLLKCAQEKEMMLNRLQQNKGSQYYATYQSITRSQLDRLKGVQPPKGLEQFKNDLLAAIDLQMKFFAKAVDAQARGSGMDGIMAIPEGKQASSFLIDAWNVMDHRYMMFWGGASKDSIYHHLCAYDLF